MHTPIPTGAALAAMDVSPPDRDLSLTGLMPGEDAGRALEVAVCRRALELYPPDEEDRPDYETRLEQGESAGETRHIVAVGLVLDLALGWGFPWGKPPPEWMERYERAHAVMEYYCGACRLSVEEAPDGPAAAPDDPEWARGVIDLAIRLVCDPGADTERFARAASGAEGWHRALRPAWPDEDEMARLRGLLALSEQVARAACALLFGTRESFRARSRRLECDDPEGVARTIARVRRMMEVIAAPRQEARDAARRKEGGR